MNDMEGDSSCSHSWVQILTIGIQEFAPCQVNFAAGDVNRLYCKEN